ncbi:GtrA family protein [Nonomuraea candida]|uniref:GtrA family protein n=1 Tax=Nonomuraea candida TaxID=359159 RepID=UPI0014705BBE|nr:GtrA family protein [Nonomuraea candida]
MGSACFAFQYGCAATCAALGVPWPAANAAGFLLSAQANFLLSSGWTWGDRKVKRTMEALRRRWIAYNGTALLALVINTVVFTAAYELAGSLPAALLGVLSGAGLTYLVCDRGIFRRRRRARRPVRNVPATGPAATTRGR